MAEVSRRGKLIRDEVRKVFWPETFHLLLKKQQALVRSWCDDVPELGFNSGRYDLNLIKEHLAGFFADKTRHVKEAKDTKKIMYMLPPGFRLLDIINYLGPGTSYDKWVKAYGCENTKSWFPYEWFDSPEKLDFPGLPDHPEWYSSLKGEWVLTPDEWRGCVKTFEEKGRKTFADWLRYYNNLDVGPGLEALDKMRGFYTKKRHRHFERRGKYSGG